MTDPAPILLNFPIEVSPKYDKWLILTSLPEITFFNSTKFPIFVFWLKTVFPLILAKGPTETFFLIEQFSIC